MDEKDKTIKELENRIVLLEEKLAYDDKMYELLERRVDDSEQYGRRTSLRINGIVMNVNETSQDCLTKVKAVVRNRGLQLDDSDLDRAHRVGRSTDRDGNPVHECQMLVKFTSFRARTDVYRNRVKEEGRPRIYIDQTTRRFKLRKMAVEYVKNKPHVDFVFVDVNCNLSLRLKNGQFKFFNSEDELIKQVG